MQIDGLHNLYRLVLPLFVWKGTGTDKTNGDLILVFCIVLEPCQNEALDFTNGKSILPRGTMHLSKKPHQNTYLVLSCQLLAFSLFSQSYLFNNFYLKKNSYHIITDEKDIPQILGFFPQQLFNLIFRNIELLTHFTEIPS